MKTTIHETTRAGVLTLALALTLPVLANEPAPGSAPAGARPPAATGAAAGPSAPPSPPRAFKDVVKDAREIRGYFTLWQKDDKTWIELRPDQLEQPFFFSSVRTRAIGEKRVLAGLMGPRHIVHLRKFDNQVQLIARNMSFRAKPGIAVERAVKAGFSDSLLASATAASLPHPESKSVLVDASALLLGDIAGMATRLETEFRLPFALDRSNSHVVKAETGEAATAMEVSLHFSVPKIPAPPAAPSPTQRPASPPLNTPDPRSLFLGYRYNFSPLPEPMAPRLADERVGHFTTGFSDFTDDLNPNPNVHYVNRWRLEKKDPSAALSEPRRPIVYWVDRNVPEKYRKAVIDGVLEWNKAFERIGFKDAIQAKLQPEDATFDTADIRHATIRWYLSSDGGPAIGPSQVDPRTGEILDADILMTDGFARGTRRFVVDDVPRGFGATSAAGIPALLHDAHEQCTFASDSHEEAGFAMDLLEARGEIEPGSPEADAFVQAYIKSIVTHEVGHTLGLRHNFRSSTIFTAEQLRDPAFTRKNGIVGSIMDYPPFNIPLKGEEKSDYVMPGIGPYDYWAVEYAYKPIDAAQEKDELAKIAARGAREPWLAYGTDEDASIGGAPEGMDPTVNVWDLSSEPLAYYRKRLNLSRELWDRLQEKTLKPGESYDTLRRSLDQGFRQLGRGLAPVTKYIGGVVQLRDRAGTGRLPFTPVPAAQQREALKLLSDGMFSVDSFKFKPELLASVPHNRLDYWDDFRRGNIGRQPMFSLSATILGLQRRVLDQLMNDVVATRIVESREFAAKAKEVFQLSELYDTLQSSIWGELKSGREITLVRRNLQREHVKRVTAMLLKPSANLPADAQSLMRVKAIALAAQIRQSKTGRGLSPETKAHLAESQNSLEEALKAPLQRAGV